MPHCMVPGCKNASQLCDGSVSFHRIPTDKTKQKIWLSKIPRVNLRSLSYSYVCSDHFSKDCFEVSFMEQLTGNKQRRRLLPEAVPTEFLNRSPVKPRKNTQLRFQKRARNEVCYIFNSYLINVYYGIKTIFKDHKKFISTTKKKQNSDHCLTVYIHFNVINCLIIRYYKNYSERKMNQVKIQLM